MDQLKVGVILLNWNSLEHTTDCIESLLKDSSLGVKVYVVDNASGNGESLQLASRFPSVKVLPQQTNLGFCAGNNLGIRHAMDDGMEYIMMLNNDTIVPDNAIRLLVEQFHLVPGVGAISPVIMEYPEVDKIWFSKAVWDTSRAQFVINPGAKKFNELTVNTYWESDFACGCCLLTSTEVIRKVGLLDERYFAYYDEAEWCKRLLKHGYRSFVTSKARIYHKVSGTTPQTVSIYLLTRNRLLWMKENLPFRTRFKSFRYLLRELVWHQTILWGLTKPQYGKNYSKAFIRGYRDYLKRRFGKWSSATEKIIMNGS